MLKKLFKAIILFFLIAFIGLAGLFANVYYEQLQDEKQQEYFSSLSKQYNEDLFLPYSIEDMLNIYKKTANKTVAIYQTIDKEYYVEIDNNLKNPTDIKIADINNYKEVAATYDDLVKEILSYKSKNIPYDLQNIIEMIEYRSSTNLNGEPKIHQKKQEQNIIIQILNFIGNNLVYLKWFLIIMFISFVLNAITGNLPSIPKRKSKEEFEKFSDTPVKKKEEPKKSRQKENTAKNKDKEEEYQANIFHIVEENSSTTWTAYPSLEKAIEAISNKVHPYWIYEQHSFSITDHGVYKNGKKIAEKTYW